ncbi:hypothetical protein GF343_01550 [Candidatus Woesearchaeota archaeon]|nr:hypothetical protein [Candidatus Woesearchaeota archaeon]
MKHMKRTLIILGILLAALMLVVACAPKEIEKAPAKKEAPTKEEAKETIKKEEVKKEKIKKEEVKEPGTGTTAEEDITAVDKEVTEIGDIAEDLNMSDLEELDKDLQELESLEI